MTALKIKSTARKERKADAAERLKSPPKNPEGYLYLLGKIIGCEQTARFYTEDHQIDIDKIIEVEKMIRWIDAGIAQLENPQERIALEKKYSLKTIGGKLQVLENIMKVVPPAPVRGKIISRLGVTRQQANDALNHGLRHLRQYREQSVEPGARK